LDSNGTLIPPPYPHSHILTTIPENPDEIHKILLAVTPLNFHTTFGAFAGVEVRGGTSGKLKIRLLESAKVAVRRMGWTEHEVLKLEVGTWEG
jgi:hypothetical protein